MQLQSKFPHGFKLQPPAQFKQSNLKLRSYKSSFLWVSMAVLLSLLMQISLAKSNANIDGHSSGFMELYDAQEPQYQKQMQIGGSGFEIQETDDRQVDTPDVSRYQEQWSEMKSALNGNNSQSRGQKIQNQSTMLEQLGDEQSDQTGIPRIVLTINKQSDNNNSDGILHKNDSQIQQDLEKQTNEAPHSQNFQISKQLKKKMMNNSSQQQNISQMSSSFHQNRRVEIPSNPYNFIYLYPFYCSNASQPYRCPNSSYCAASYFECISLNSSKCNNASKPHYCTFNATCVTNITTDCCPYNSATQNIWCATQQKCVGKITGAGQCCDWTPQTPIWCNSTQSCVATQTDCCMDFSQWVTTLVANAMTYPNGTTITTYKNVTNNTKYQNCSVLTSNKSTEPKCAVVASECFVPIKADCKNQILSQKYLPGNTTYIQCWDGSCRLNQSECPNQRACPYGYVMCQGINTCMKGFNYTLCPNTTLNKCYDKASNTTGFLCPYDGGLVCKSSPDQCPSLTTCSNSSMVVCPDGTCQPNPYMCQQPATDYCQNMTVNLTLNVRTSMVTCPDNSCAANLSYCNATRPPTCLPGQSLCQDNSCQYNCSNVSAQYPFCKAWQVKCPNQALCRDSYDQCPPGKSCPSTSPIQCWSGACAATVSECPAYPSATYCQDATGKGTICYDGSCASDSSGCPTPVTCPSNMTKCSDSRCAPNITECQPTDRCNRIKCLNGECVNKISECPSQVKCPLNLPYKCENQQCVGNFTECVNISMTLYNLRKNLSSNGQQCRIICNDGQCVGARDQCPSAVVCSEDAPVKCWDRTCQPSLAQCPNSTTANHTCDVVSFPNSTYQCQDGSCRSRPQDCPTLPSCGLLDPTKPVLCYDCTCRASISQCPLYSGGCPYNGTQCSDGSCTTTTTTSGSGVVSQCSSQMTCSKKYPVKCLDGTCKSNIRDCLSWGNLPNTIAPIEDSTYSKGLPCAPKEIMCNGQCYSDRTQCMLSGDFKLTCPVSFPVLGPDQGCYTSIDFYNQQLAVSCPFNYIRCNDNSCQKDYSLCPTKQCQITALPYQCKNGMCAYSASQCDSDSGGGCPFYKPVKCWNGTCVSQSGQCTAQKQCNSTSQLCPDGSCQGLSTTCLNAMGCPALRPYKCADGTCIDPIYSQCTVATNMICNPRSQYPVKCPNGLCVSSLSNCQASAADSQIDASYCYNVSAPFTDRSANPLALYLCGDGKCVVNSDQCAPLNDCVAPLTRCNDGSCRLANCPITQYNCPYHKPNRCLSGLCVANLLTDCIQQSNGCPLSAPFKCVANGRCMADSASCSVFSAQLNSTVCVGGLTYCAITGNCYNPLTDASSCTAKCPLTTAPYQCGTTCLANATDCQSTACDSTTSFLCPDGSCVSSATQCLTIEKCPVTKPFKCADQSCATLPFSSSTITSTTISVCSMAVVCNSERPIRCADGSCQTSSGDCLLISNCTYTCPIDGRCVSDLGQCNVCPMGAPYRCLATGMCVSDSTKCLISVNNCPKEQKVKCFDGRCVSAYSQCIYNSSSTYNASFYQNSPTILTTSTTPTCPNLDSTSGISMYLCSDGSCRANNNDCKLIRSCSDFSKPFRCPNTGTCAESLSSCNLASFPQMVCSGDQALCPDGICRDKNRPCPLYKGCPASAPLQCTNGKCVASVADCAGTSQCPSITEPFRCGNFKCVAKMTDCVPSYILYSPIQFQAHIRTLQPYAFDIVQDPTNQTTIMFLQVPSNAIQVATSSVSLSSSKNLQLQDNPHEQIRHLKGLSDPSMFNLVQTLSISTLSDSVLRSTVVPIPSNYVSYIKRILPLEDSELDFENGVVSPIFTLEVLGNSQSFNVPMLVTTKLTMPYFFDPNNDICLGTLNTQTSQWNCVSRNPIIDTQNQWYSFKVYSPGTFAVIISPNPDQISQSSFLSAYVTSIPECNWWCQNYKLVFALQIVLLTVVLFLIILIWRVIAYAKASWYAKREIEKFNQKQAKSKTKQSSKSSGAPVTASGLIPTQTNQGSFYDNTNAMTAMSNNVYNNINGTYDDDQQTSVLKQLSMMEDISVTKKKDKYALQQSNSSMNERSGKQGRRQQQQYPDLNEYEGGRDNVMYGVPTTNEPTVLREEKKQRLNPNESLGNRRSQRERSSRSRTPVPNESDRQSQGVSASRKYGASGSITQNESGRESEGVGSTEKVRRRRRRPEGGADGGQTSIQGLQESATGLNEMTRPLMEGDQQRDRSRHRQRNRDASNNSHLGQQQTMSAQQNQPDSANRGASRDRQGGHKDLTEQQRQERRERRKLREQAAAAEALMMGGAGNNISSNNAGLEESEEAKAQRRRLRREQKKQAAAMASSGMNSMVNEEVQPFRTSQSPYPTNNESPVKKQRDPNRNRSRPRAN